jgi:hypothetical protein
MSMSVKGNIKRILDTRVISEKFSVREFDIETTDRYPQVLRMQASNDRIALLNGLGVGDSVNVELNLRGREWTGNDGVTKVFNTLDAWKVERTGAAQSGSSSGSAGGGDQDMIPFASCDISLEPSPIAKVLR